MARWHYISFLVAVGCCLIQQAAARYAAFAPAPAGEQPQTSAALNVSAPLGAVESPGAALNGIAPLPDLATLVAQQQRMMQQQPSSPPADPVPVLPPRGGIGISAEYLIGLLVLAFLVCIMVLMANQRLRTCLFLAGRRSATGSSGRDPALPIMPIVRPAPASGAAQEPPKPAPLSPVQLPIIVINPNKEVDVAVQLQSPRLVQPQPDADSPQKQPTWVSPFATWTPEPGVQYVDFEAELDLQSSRHSSLRQPLSLHGSARQDSRHLPLPGAVMEMARRDSQHYASSSRRDSGQWPALGSRQGSLNQLARRLSGPLFAQMVRQRYEQLHPQEAASDLDQALLGCSLGDGNSEDVERQGSNSTRARDQRGADRGALDRCQDQNLNVLVHDNPMFRSARQLGSASWHSGGLHGRHSCEESAMSREQGAASLQRHQTAPAPEDGPRM